MKQLITDIAQWFSALPWVIGWFFDHSGTIILWIIIIYIICIILLSLRLRSANTTFTKLTTLFQEPLDDLYYQTSVILYRQKDNIYDASATIPLLLKYKTEEIAKNDEANYYNNYEKLVQEIDYIGEFTEQKIMYDRPGLDAQHSIIKQFHSTIIRLRMSLLALTLWIAKFFL